MIDSDSPEIIKVSGLTKRYRRFTAVDNVSFSARAGAVTGYLGPNGAGKSTTMRMMVGLASPTEGRCTVLGRPYRELPNPGAHVGVLLDAAAQHVGRTGHEVLTLGASTIGVDRRRVDELLASFVDLSPAAGHRRVGNYSLGMRQRLGIAHALLGHPSVLILDEPANGLDPAGIHWMRRLLRDFADEGGTVLLSSHLLHEIEILADDLVVINQGKVVKQGSKKEMLASGGTYVRALDNQTLEESLRRAGLEYRADEGGFVTKAGNEMVAQAAAAGGATVVELRSDSTGIEDMFLELTGDGRTDVQTTKGNT